MRRSLFAVHTKMLCCFHSLAAMEFAASPRVDRMMRRAKARLKDQTGALHDHAHTIIA